MTSGASNELTTKLMGNEILGRNSRSPNVLLQNRSVQMHRKDEKSSKHSLASMRAEKGN